MAGGGGAITKAAEDVEDSAQDGRRDILRYNICENDTIIGISASGNAEYVYFALNTANEKGCTTISFSNNEDCKITDIKIITDTGAEIITGSTRMKAGNAQKMVLNMISTTVTIKTGKVYENFMINLKTHQQKTTTKNDMYCM